MPEEREKLHLAVAAASERFIASYPRMDAAEARARVPSFYALELPRALEGALPKLKEFEARTREAALGALELAGSEDRGRSDRRRGIRSGSRLGKQKRGARYLMEANSAPGAEPARADTRDGGRRGKKRTG